MRACWLPRQPELPEQCVSCPFREGNDPEWSTIVTKLRKALGVRGPVTQEVLDHARAKARKDLEFSGEFACHLTVYDADMNRKPDNEGRQCRGASAIYRMEVP